MNIKDIIEKIYDNNKYIFILGMVILLEMTFNFFSEKVDLISKVEKLSSKNNTEIQSIIKKIDRISNKTENVVLRPSWNAYIARKDDEYHKQETFNDEITLKMGVLEGRFSVIEKIFYDLNRNRIYEYGKHENG